MAHQHENEQQHQSLTLDALYCEEESWEDMDRGDCLIEEQICCGNDVKPNPPTLLEEDLLWEEEELCSLFRKERENDLHSGLDGNISLAEARTEAGEWILKATAYYSFSAATAVLAVNYLDRFHFSFQSQSEKKPWMTQLAAVACLSLAAKVEETRVPLLLDLQAEESKYVFEARTIQRMELLVLSTLQWKMNPVTPLSFLNYYVTRRLGLQSNVCWEFLRRCEGVLLSVISDCRFMCYLPSVMATATMLHVSNSRSPCLGVEYRTEQLLAILGFNKDKVEDCYRLIPVVASGFYFHSSNKRKFRSLPGSPIGVMDMSFSSDSSNDSWSVATSLSSSPEPRCKRSKANAEDQIDGA